MGFRLHDHAVADLDAILESDSAAGAYLAALLEAIHECRDPIDALLPYGNSRLDDWLLNTKPWIQGTGRNRNQLWRARMLECPATAYRIVYGYHQATRQIVVLGLISKKDFDYGTTSPFALRVLRDWRELCT